jgi:hypothetical protein
MALSMKNLTVQLNNLMLEDFLEHSEKLVKDGERSKNEHDILKSFVEIYRQSQPKSASVKMQKDYSSEENHSDSGSSTSEKKKREGKPNFWTSYLKLRISQLKDSDNSPKERGWHMKAVSTEYKNFRSEHKEMFKFLVNRYKSGFRLEHQLNWYATDQETMKLFKRFIKEQEALENEKKAKKEALKELKKTENAKKKKDKPSDKVDEKKANKKKAEKKKQAKKVEDDSNIASTSTGLTKDMLYSLSVPISDSESDDDSEDEGLTTVDVDYVPGQYSSDEDEE